MFKQFLLQGLRDAEHPLLNWVGGGGLLKLIPYERNKTGQACEFFNKISQWDSSPRSRDSSLRSE